MTAPAKHILRIAGVAAALALAAHYCKPREDEESAATAARAAATARIERAVAEHGATRAWEAQVCGSEARSPAASLLTIELERAWLSQPILFLGIIRDISTDPSAEGTYRITLEYDILAPGACYLHTTLRLALVCPRRIVEHVLANPRALNDLAATVAAVADVGAVRTENVTNSFGERVEARTGDGRCLDLIDITAL